MSSILISLISIIVLLGVIIGIHELGHFLAARKFNVHVIRFKIGFGKTLVSRFVSRELNSLSVYYHWVAMFRC